MRQRLDIRRPEAMEEYLSLNGWHFNKKSAEYACSLMYKKNSKGEREYIDAYSVEELRQMLIRTKADINEEDIWDALYVANTGKADLMDDDEAVIEDERHLVYYVKKTINDADAADGTIFAQWYAGMCMKGIRPNWEDMI